MGRAHADLLQAAGHLPTLVLSPNPCSVTGTRGPTTITTSMSTPAGEAAGAGTPEAAAPFSADWKERMLVPVAAAGEPPSPVPLFLPPPPLESGTCRGFQYLSGGTTLIR
jgi:hypothetical protein